MNARLGTGCSIMIEGRRARSVRGSPHGDRPIRRGASVTGVCQCASRAFSLWCRASTACTDGSSPGHWLGRSSYPGLGSRRNNHAVRDSCSTSARVRGPPRVRVHRRRFKNGLTNKSSWKRTLGNSSTERFRAASSLRRYREGADSRTGDGGSGGSRRSSPRSQCVSWRGAPLQRNQRGVAVGVHLRRRFRGYAAQSLPPQQGARSGVVLGAARTCRPAQKESDSDPKTPGSGH